MGHECDAYCCNYTISKAVDYSCFLCASYIWTVDVISQLWSFIHRQRFPCTTAWVPPLLILRMDPSNLQVGQPCYGNLWWNSCCRSFLQKLYCSSQRPIHLFFSYISSWPISKCQIPLPYPGYMYVYMYALLLLLLLFYFQPISQISASYYN